MTTFVVANYTNVPVKDLTSSATFSVRRTFSYTNPLARNIHFSLLEW